MHKSNILLIIVFNKTNFLKKQKSMNTLDFKHFDKKFDNVPEKIGEECSDIDKQRLDFMRDNIDTYKPVRLSMPEIAGLKKHVGRLPVTRQWYRRSASYELNGLLNVQTPVMNTKMLYWLWWPAVGWGNFFLLKIQKTKNFVRYLESCSVSCLHRK